MANKEIWIYAERHGDMIQPVTYQLITKAKEIANDKKVVVVLFESSKQDLKDLIKPYGPDEIIIVKNDILQDVADSLIADLLAQLVKLRNPNAILFGATVIGRSISARLQAKIHTGLTADCLDLSFEDDLLIQTKPSYGDNIMCEIICPNNYPQMASVRPNVFTAKQVENTKVKITEANNLVFTPSKRIKVNAERPLLSKSDSIANASRVVAIGRGAASKKTVESVQLLASKLGAKIGVTRPLTDQYPFTTDDQIGQSGNAVKPQLLLNLGIHGAAQYTTGITNSEVIVSVNKDEQAPIFDFSDFKFVGDVNEFISELLKIIQ